jgi:hypothetical protein
MKAHETITGSETLPPRTNGNGHGVSSMPEEFAELYQTGYEAGLASARELGYRQGYQAGFGDGRRQGDAGSTAAAAAVENTPPGIRRARLFGLPCVKCKRFLYNDEERCPYCRTPRALPAELTSATGS